jgi:hypothetical protein
MTDWTKALTMLLCSFAATAVFAESRVSAIAGNNPSTTMSATARLNVSVVVPKILYFRVGDPGAIVNLFRIELSFLGMTVPTTNSVFTTTPSAATRLSTISDNDGNGLAGRIAARLWTNNGTAQLSCSGPPLTSGAQTEPLSAIQAGSWFTTDTLPHPGNNLSCPSTNVGTAGFNDLNSSWFYYINSGQFLSPGSFTTRVTYTASQP